MVAEPGQGTYPDDILRAILERFPTPDADGLRPDESAWVEGYDLNAAAQEIWGQKAAAAACKVDLSADGVSRSLSQLNTQALKMAAFYGARRRPGTIVLEVEPSGPEELDPEVVDGLPVDV